MSQARITFEDRKVIEKMIREQKSNPEIAVALHRHRTSISREITRNSLYRSSYSAFFAQYLYDLRKTAERQKPVTGNSEILSFVATHIKKLSPDVISGRASLEKNTYRVSTESIYAIVYNDRKNGGSLWTYLPSRRSRRKTSRFNKENSAGCLKNQVSFRYRPEGANNRSRHGHFEGDTIVGKGHKSMVFTAIDRKNKMAFAHKLKMKGSDGVYDAIRIMKSEFGESLLSITVDNGKEFACHEKVIEDFGIRMFFADPGKPYQRGSNENFNRQMRRYFPKGIDFRKVKWQSIRSVVEKLNNTPRKSLNYLTPMESFGAKQFGAILI